MRKTLLTLLLALVAFSAMAQVRGVVYDGATGDPFMGVSVLVKGTMTGVNTGADGSFSLPAKVGDVLQFSFIGYLDQEVTITS
ncbi:MAG: carboxypeptidase-like regulatory domain-containing protein, partial [Bacteroidales bacterium]|nr:carboxypeptidase-like regulatory domain-containing protein [Bacteroidales bacterium]